MTDKEKVLRHNFRGSYDDLEPAENGEIMRAFDYDRLAAKLDTANTEAYRIDELEANINIKADFIDATINQLAASDQRIEELEAQIKEDALQYLSDTGQMGEAVDDLTRRHQHALHKIDVLEDEIESLMEDKSTLVVENEKLRKALDIYERERIRFKHAKPEMTGEFFIAGYHGPKDDNVMPQFIEVCPAYGAGWVMIYEDTGRTINYEGS